MSKKKVQEQAPELFELNETVKLKWIASRRGREYSIGHELRRPTEAEWIEYDKALSYAIEHSEEIEGGVHQVNNSLAAASALWDKIVHSVTGYFPAGEDLTNGWRQRIPPGNKQEAIVELTSIAPAPQDEIEDTLLGPISDEEIVRLVAFTKSGPILTHRFRPPSVKSRIEYDRMLSDRVVIHGTKRGRDKTVIPSWLGRSVGFYNESILGVEGYTLNGNPLVDRDEVIKWMDAQHKAAAVHGLFSTGTIL